LKTGKTVTYTFAFFFGTGELETHIEGILPREAKPTEAICPGRTNPEIVSMFWKPQNQDL